jgi:hypothetical protein
MATASDYEKPTTNSHFSTLSATIRPTMMAVNDLPVFDKFFPRAKKIVFSFRNRLLKHNVKVLFQDTVVKKPRYAFFPRFFLSGRGFRGLARKCRLLVISIFPTKNGTNRSVK